MSTEKMVDLIWTPAVINNKLVVSKDDLHATNFFWGSEHLRGVYKVRLLKPKLIRGIAMLDRSKRYRSKLKRFAMLDRIDNPVEFGKIVFKESHND